MKWHNVTKGNPCPICGKGDWCGFNEDESMCICMRSPNEYPSKNGGYIYIREGGEWKSPYKRLSFAEGYKCTPPPLNPFKTAPKWSNKRLSAKEVETFIKEDANITFDNDNFGVKEVCGEDGFTECYTAWGFGCYESKSHQGCLAIPMKNAGGETVGIRFRHPETKAKTSLFGGSDGLFFSWQIFKRKIDTLFIVEGATDAIALAAVGFDVIGRSSCATGTEHIRQILNILKPRNLVYVADNDHAKLIANKYREAGREGARKLANDIGRPYKMISPLNAKDIREYILNHRQSGALTGQIRVHIERMVRDARIQFKAI